MRRVVKRIGEEVGRLEESNSSNGGGGVGIYFQPAIPVTFEINTWFAAGGGGGDGGGGGGDGCRRRRRRGYTEQELLQARDIVQEKTSIRVFEKLAEGKFPNRILREEREEEEEVVVVRKLEGLSTGVEEGGGESESAQQAGNATAATDADNESENPETLSAHYFGWGLSSLTENLDDEVFVKGYVELWKELVRIDEGREGGC